MPDESNFCLNCGENFAKYRTPSGFIKESGEDAGPAGTSPAAPRADPEAASRGGAERAAAPDGPPRVELTTTGQAVAEAEPVAPKAEGLIAQARSAVDAGKLEEAVEAFRAAAALDPGSEQAWWGLGVTYGRLGRQLDALAAFNRLLEAHPRLASGFDGKGTALASLGRLGEAIAALDEALRLDPSLNSARLEKGVALARMDDAKAALACFDAVVAAEPNNLDAWLQRADILTRLNDAPLAMQAYDRALEVQPLAGQAWRKKGDLLLKMGHASDAKRCFDRAIQLDANDFDALVRRGDALRQAGDPAGAIDSYDRAAKLRPAQADPLVRKGLLFFSLSQYPTARDCFAGARDLEPDNQVACVNLAVALYRCREFAAAKQAAEAALVRWPGQVELMRVLSAAERKLALGDAAAPGRAPRPPGADHTVEDMFLIYRDGRLIAHQTRRLRADMDNQLLSGMLTAIQSFIREAFREGDEGELNEMAFGKNQILLERGKWVSLAVVIRGQPAIGTRAELAFAVQNIEQRYAQLLDEWDGDARTLRGVGEVVKRILEVL